MLLIGLSFSSVVQAKDRKPTNLSARGGIASWHDYSRERNSYYLRNGNMITASRNYPCGTILKVYNKADRKKGKNAPYIFVTVRDWGPARWTGRNLDLNKPAFRKLSKTGAGEIRVTYYVVKMGHCKIHRH